MTSDFTDAFSSKYSMMSIEYTYTNDAGEEEDRVWEFELDQIKRVFCHWIPTAPIEEEEESEEVKPKSKRSRKPKAPVT